MHYISSQSTHAHIFSGNPAAQPTGVIQQPKTIGGHNIFSPSGELVLARSLSLPQWESSPSLKVLLSHKLQWFQVMLAMDLPGEREKRSATGAPPHYNYDSMPPLPPPQSHYCRKRRKTRRRRKRRKRKRRNVTNTTAKILQDLVPLPLGEGPVDHSFKHTHKYPIAAFLTLRNYLCIYVVKFSSLLFSALSLVDCCVETLTIKSCKSNLLSTFCTDE